MSHFPVAVISEKLEDVERLMAPYQENNMGDCPKEYLKFHDEEENYLKQYEEESVEKIKKPDGRLLNPWDEEFRVKDKFGYGSDTHEVPDEYERIQIRYKDLYISFDEFMKDWHSSERDPETGKYGYWENPNRKWDYWRIGGRWRGMLKAKKGSLGDLAWEHKVNDNSFSDVPSRFDSAQIKDIIFERDENLYKKAIRFWEVCVDKQELLPNEKKEDFNSFYKPQYYLDKYGTKEVYAKTESILCPWAMVTPDGEWYEQGNMGFWGINDASKNSTISFISIFEKTLKDTNPEDFITILDCHI